MALDKQKTNKYLLFIELDHINQDLFDISELIVLITKANA